MSDRSNNVIVTCIPGGVSKVEAGRTLDGLVETGLLLCWQSPLEGGHGHTLRRLRLSSHKTRSMTSLHVLPVKSITAKVVCRGSWRVINMISVRSSGTGGRVN